MVQILTRKTIVFMLDHPEDYITVGFDEPILRIIKKDASNPVVLLLGYDEQRELYYFTLEDNEASQDFYCEDGNLAKMFIEIMEGKGEYEIWVRG